MLSSALHGWRLLWDEELAEGVTKGLIENGAGTSALSWMHQMIQSSNIFECPSVIELDLYTHQAQFTRNSRCHCNKSTARLPQL